MAVFCGESILSYMNQVNRSIYKKINSYDFRQLKDFSDNDINDIVDFFKLCKVDVDFSFENAIKISICKSMDDVLSQDYLFTHKEPSTVKVKGNRIGFKIRINEKLYTHYSPDTGRTIYFYSPEDDNYNKINLYEDSDGSWLLFYVFIPDSFLDGIASDEAVEIIKREFNRYLLGTKTMIKRMNDEIDCYNKSLNDFVRKTIKTKISDDSKLSLLSDAIGIEISTKNNAQQKGKKIEILPKKSDIMLPERKKYDGYYIDKSNYNSIISTIRHHLEATESNPLAIRKLNNEELIRDTILWALSSNYFIASGETFRQSGKTDILISFKDKSAFIAECKIWRGNKYVSEAIDQLLSYTTWRDSKSCIIIFNLENKDYDSICHEMLEIAKKHKSFKKINSYLGNEFECEFKDSNNTESSITITFLLANYVIR